ncbi:hypothetical protein [Desulfonatronovibrio magnus]|uniref:hypothetical protein n=1 Tax=Desulfonatronovibrio magnus TaxID=698827 RepID=UPI0005EBC215|nr:hypothetical protein [Desulfonatronovibrio magnus]
MDANKIKDKITPQVLETIFPIERSNDFFEAFYGDSADSHFDIRLGLEKVEESRIILAFHLIQRPGKCLACNMTYGLPQVLDRHPIININGLVSDLASQVGLDPSQVQWKLGNTHEKSSELHTVPLIITFN